MRLRLFQIIGLLGLVSACILSAFYPDTSEVFAEPKHYLVEMNEDPIITYRGGIKDFEATVIDNKYKLDLQDEHVQKYRQLLANKRDQLKAWIDHNIGPGRVKAEFSLTLNAIGVKATPMEIKLIASAPNVARVVPTKSYKPAMNRSSSIINGGVPFSSRYKGENIKIAIIDTGIDVDHPFLRDDSLPMPPGFPKVDNPEWAGFTSNKVIVARVFSDDKSATPEASDPHGTHVAGIASGIEGYTDPSGMVSSPLSGVAPKAYLGSYNVVPKTKVGEAGVSSTVHIISAIEAAVNDGMDVINLSLGCWMPGCEYFIEKAINGAVQSGVTVVACAGNTGPEKETILGGIASSDSAITVGAVQNSHLFEGSEHESENPNAARVWDPSSRGPFGDKLKPDVAAVGADVYSSIPGGGFESDSGTSMAAPHVAGAAAILRQAHPEWTPVDIKSALMVTASDPSGGAAPIEVGAGIINIGRALKPLALAYPSSLSFGKLNSSSSERKAMSLSILNRSLSARSYNISIDDADIDIDKKEIFIEEGKSAKIDVSVSAHCRSRGLHQGYITIKSGSDSIRVPYLLISE